MTLSINLASVMSQDMVTLLAVVGALVLGCFIWIRHLNKKGRQVLLRGLAVLDDAHREQLLAKFTPKVQAQLRKELDERRNA